MFIFGYGSLIWNPGFEYEEKLVGRVRGYARRFWQGSELHRGVPGQPGRVAVVVPSTEPDEEVWGVAFKVSKENADEVLRTLSVRESGYAFVTTSFYPAAGGRRRPITVGIYVALKDNPSYLGPAPVPEIARTIYHSKGRSGTNLEYFVKLVQSLSDILPPGVVALDRHLDELQREIARLSSSASSSLVEMMASEE